MIHVLSQLDARITQLIHAISLTYVIWNIQTNKVRRLGTRLRCVVESSKILVKGVPLLVK